MISIFIKEFNSFLDSLIAYLVIGVFLVANGLFMWILAGDNVLDNGFATMDGFFATSPYLLLFLIPAVTMRSFAEEQKNGTLELLFTKPIPTFQIVLGKFLATFTLVLVAILPTLVYCYSLSKLGNPINNLDIAGIVGSYLGLILLAAIFTAIGVLASAWSENQISSFILAIFLCYVFYAGFSAIATLDFFIQSQGLVESFGIASHFASLSKGLIDSRDLVYFLSVTFLCLYATYLRLESKKWA